MSYSPKTDKLITLGHMRLFKKNMETEIPEKSSDLSDGTDIVKKKSGVTWGDLKKPK